MALLRPLFAAAALSPRPQIVRPTPPPRPHPYSDAGLRAALGCVFSGITPGTTNISAADLALYELMLGIERRGAAQGPLAPAGEAPLGGAPIPLPDEVRAAYVAANGGSDVGLPTGLWYAADARLLQLILLAVADQLATGTPITNLSESAERGLFVRAPYSALPMLAARVTEVVTERVLVVGPTGVAHAPLTAQMLSGRQRTPVARGDSGLTFSLQSTHGLGDAQVAVPEAGVADPALRITLVEAAEAGARRRRSPSSGRPQPPRMFTLRYAPLCGGLLLDALSGGASAMRCYATAVGGATVGFHRPRSECDLGAWPDVTVGSGHTPICLFVVLAAAAQQAAIRTKRVGRGVEVGWGAVMSAEGDTD